MLFRTDAFKMSVLYLIFGVVAMIIGGLDMLFPERTRMYTDVSMSGYNVTYPTLISLGIVIGIVFAPLILLLKIEPFSIKMSVSGVVFLITTGFWFLSLKRQYFPTLWVLVL